MPGGMCTQRTGISVDFQRGCVLNPHGCVSTFVERMRAQPTSMFVGSWKEMRAEPTGLCVDCLVNPTHTDW
eukprot:11946056-Prorocentrum_lima.AAC.1